MTISLNKENIQGGAGMFTGTLSVIIPITQRYDEIRDIYREYKDALSAMGIPYEMIFVVDGDFSNVYEELKSLKKNGEGFVIIKHSRSFGEATAIMAGFKNSTGCTIMTLPAYHQVEASELQSLLANLENHDMVIARRWPRNDSWINQNQTKIFHSIVYMMTGKISTDLGCSVRLFKRKILEEINLYGDLHRFLPILANKQGFSVIEIDLRQSAKEKRFRTYPLGIYIRRMIDLLSVFFLVKFTKKPLRFFGLTGTAVLFIGLFITFYLIISKLFFNIGLSDRPLFLIGILFIVLGIQIFAIGLIGEIIIFTHAKEIKEYTVENIIN
jgi:glycosyltransferase involved in cell wall biosynthesis